MRIIKAELVAPSAQGFSGEWEYKAEVEIKIEDESKYDDIFFEVVRKFCLKYGTEIQSVKVNIKE